MGAACGQVTVLGRPRFGNILAKLFRLGMLSLDHHD